MARRRIALIGLGMAATPHARSLMDLSDRVEVAHAFSPSEARRSAFATRLPFPLADDFEAILDSDVDALFVLTPPNTHLDLVSRAANAGKDVLLEKPLEVSRARAATLVQVCRSAGVILGVVLQHRFRPAAVQLREILKAGGLGRIIAASASVRVFRPQSYYDEPGRGTLARDGGGVLLTQAIHTLDLYLSLVGAVDEVSAYVTTTPVHLMETEDLVCATVKFEHGALGIIEATTAAYPGFPERIEITGEAGSATLIGTELNVFWSDGRRRRVQPDETPGGSGSDPMDFPHAYHRDLISDFLDALAAGREPAASGNEVLKVHELIHALIESGREGRPVRVRQPARLDALSR